MQELRTIESLERMAGSFTALDVLVLVDYEEIKKHESFKSRIKNYGAVTSRGGVQELREGLETDQDLEVEEVQAVEEKFTNAW